MNFKLGFGVAAVAALALSAVAEDNGDDTTAAVCPGCVFVDASSPPNPGPGANVCGTELRISVFGMSGRCERAAPGAACLPAAGCLALRVVEIKSTCSMRLEWYPSGGGMGSFGFQPIDGWLLADFSLLGLACGSPAEHGYYKLIDAKGFFITNSYFYRCTACED